MACTELVKDIKIKLESGLSPVKDEPETVEIGLDDILNSSDEENGPDIYNQDSDKKENIPLCELRPGLKTLNSKTEIDGSEPSKKESDEEVSDEDESEDDKEFSAVDNLETGEQLILNFAKKLDDAYEKSGGIEEPEGTNWADVYKTFQTTNCQEEMRKVVVTQAPRTAAVIETHEFTTLSRNKHICNHCQFIFKRMKDLRRHIRWKHRDVTNMYQCPYCPFKSKWTIKQHIIFKHKHDKEILWFKCHLCERKFKVKSALTNHMYSHLSSAEMGDLMKPCSMCPKKFKTGDGLARHVRFVHNKEPHKRIQCRECDYNCVDAGHMRHHVEFCHSTSEQQHTYACEDCDYTTKYEYQYKCHRRLHKKRFCCEKCAFVASSMQHLKLHQITHQSEIDESVLKYQCDKCDFKTYRQYNFDVHKLNHLKPHEIQYFYCYHCDFKAKRKGNLKPHVLRHFKKEEVALQCFVCDYSTKKRMLLTKHLQTHSSGAQTQPQDSS